MFLMNEIKDCIISFWRTYPQISGQAVVCSFYRKRNKTIPLVYMLYALSIVLTNISRILTVTVENFDLWYNITQGSPVLLLVGLINVMVAFYVYGYRNLAKAKENRENYEFQYHIRKILYLCPATGVLSSLLFVSYAIYGDSVFPVNILWLMCFLHELFSCMWYLDNPWIKIGHIVLYNAAFCLIAGTKHNEFRHAMLERILAPAVLTSIFLIVHDKSVKANFILKRLLKEQKSVYEKFLQKLQDPVLIVDKSSVIFSNEVARSSLGIATESFYHKAGYIISSTGVSLEDHLKERLCRPEVSQEPIKQEKYFMHEEESDKVECQRTLMVTIIESGFFSREKTIALILRDITVELLQEEKRLEDRFKNMMLYSLSHELRTPLNILQDALNLAKKMRLDKEDKSRYQSGKGAWNYLRNKINDTLTYAQLLTGEFVLHEGKFSLAKFVAYLQKMTYFLLQKKRENIKLSFQIESSLDDEFKCDRERLEQILFNLLQNAVKYTEKGEISLLTYLSRGKVVFEVSDTGCGIPESVASSLFLAATVERSRPKIFQGNARQAKVCGLGLTVSKILCYKMGGDITVSSVVGKGSIFRVILPGIGSSTNRENINACEEVSPMITPRGIPDEGCIVNPCSPNRLLLYKKGLNRDISSEQFAFLIVDDNDFNRLVAKKMIHKNKHTKYIEEADNGLVAVEKFVKIQEKMPKTKIVVFMDLDMPVMNGIEATKKIRELGGVPKPFITALTAFASESERNSCIEAGMDHFLSKPLTKENLRSLLLKLG
eukprot:TRINITY_DN472_c0_g1_i2.p1 TRINITY_DN472_c0_g1~~TRINITY_DN472_c0_g1_i2.p1  ORF type:complete len:775 (-),score=61.28 TRINITY_DN472_c0_g1_i2:165-2489(-)